MSRIFSAESKLDIAKREWRERMQREAPEASSAPQDPAAPAAPAVDDAEARLHIKMLEQTDTKLHHLNVNLASLEATLSLLNHAMRRAPARRPSIGLIPLLIVLLLGVGLGTFLAEQGLLFMPGPVSPAALAPPSHAAPAELAPPATGRGRTASTGCRACAARGRGRGARAADPAPAAGGATPAARPSGAGLTDRRGARTDQFA